MTNANFSEAQEFFSADAAVELLESQLLATTDGASRLQALLALAWQLRQRDTRRALALADELEAYLANTALAAAEQARIKYRVQLIRGEADWLFGELVAAQGKAEKALSGFEAIDDRFGSADAHWLLACVAHDQGDGARRDAQRRAMIASIEDLDLTRVTIANTALAINAAFRDVAAAKAQWDAYVSSASRARDPAAECVIEEYRGLTAMLSSEYIAAIRHYGASYTLALASGQTRRAILAATNTGAAFSNLNDHQSAFEWLQRGLDLARISAWPSSLGNALMQTGQCLRALQRLDAAHDMLRQALVSMEPLAASRSYAIALKYIGDIEIDLQRFNDALQAFESQEQRAKALNAGDLMFQALLGQARALLFLDQPERALERAHAAMQTSETSTLGTVDSLRVLADIHARHALPAPPGMRAASAALHYLQQALDLAATIDQFTIPGDLLEAVAEAHAKAGDTATAYHLALQASQAREKVHHTKADNRAIALQVKYQTERALADAEHHRQLAAANAQRADALERANNTLEQLSAIGREITANFEADAIFAALDRYIHALLVTTRFWIYRLEADGETMNRVFSAESGQTAEAQLRQLVDSSAHVMQCARERRELVIHDAPESGAATSDSPQTLSRMFVPLLVGSRVMGVMGIQSALAQTYGEREISIVRTLCAYGAIALVNDERTQELREKNRELERLSVTDRLTGLYNRLRLDQVLAKEIHRSQRYPSCFAVVLLDIDHFKSVNDCYGHVVGDQVLIEIAGLLAAGTREVDVVGRWGGEEFLIICPETGSDGAMVVAEKLRASVADHNFATVGNKTSSFGVTAFRTNDTIASMMTRVDEALYRSKANGRKCVHGAPESTQNDCLP